MSNQDKRLDAIIPGWNSLPLLDKLSRLASISLATARDMIRVTDRVRELDMRLRLLNDFTCTRFNAVGLDDAKQDALLGEFEKDIQDKIILAQRRQEESARQNAEADMAADIDTPAPESAPAEYPDEATIFGG